MISPNSPNSNIFMGMDVSKHTLDIYFCGKSHKIENDEEKIVSFIKNEIGKTPISLCVLEATGGYENLAKRLLHKYEIPVHRAHPNKTHLFAKFSGFNAKTDKIDAMILRDYAQFVFPKEKGDLPLDSTIEELKDMRRMIACSVESLHAVKCRIGQFSKSCTEHLNAQKEFLENQIDLLYKKVIGIIKNSVVINARFKRLQTITGIGPKTAAILLVEVPELGSMTKREVSSMLGLAPYTRESGIKSMHGHIRGGRFGARRALYMAALTSSRYCPHLSKIYQDLLAKGKPTKVALVAVMRKLAIISNSLLRYGRDYEAGYVGEFQAEDHA